jgi:hypothetical protein
VDVFLDRCPQIIGELFRIHPGGNGSVTVSLNEEVGNAWDIVRVLDGNNPRHRVSASDGQLRHTKVQPPMINFLAKRSYSLSDSLRSLILR